jgi:hypothetical protein
MPGRAVSSLKADQKTDPRTKTKSVPASNRPAIIPREEERAAARNQAPTGVQPVEPEDAYLTGVSRSLQRRLLGLNVDGPRAQARPHPETTAGQHATGSFTGSTSVPAQDPKKAKA